MSAFHGRIAAMVSSRAECDSLQHDDLTAFYYGRGLEGRRRDRNFRRFKHFFSDVEDEFDVIFPIGVWDRNWKIPEFSVYVEKLASQPHRSITNGRKVLAEELGREVYAAYLIAALVLAGAGLVLTRVMALGYVALVVLLYKKVRRVRRLRSRLRRLETKRQDAGANRRQRA